MRYLHRFKAAEPPKGSKKGKKAQAWWAQHNKERKEAQKVAITGYKSVP